MLLRPLSRQFPNRSCGSPASGDPPPKRCLRRLLRRTLKLLSRAGPCESTPASGGRTSLGGFRPSSTRIWRCVPFGSRRCSPLSHSDGQVCCSHRGAVLGRSSKLTGGWWLSAGGVHSQRQLDHAEADVLAAQLRGSHGPARRYGQHHGQHRLPRCVQPSTPCAAASPPPLPRVVNPP